MHMQPLSALQSSSARYSARAHLIERGHGIRPSLPTSAGIAVRACAQELEHVLVPHLFRPGHRRRPGLSVLLDRVRAAGEEKLDEVNASPAASPAEWRAFQQFVANVDARAAGQQEFSKR